MIATMGAMRFLRAAAVLFALLAALSVAVVTAGARFDHSLPGPGAVLATSPERIDIYTHRTTSAAPGDTQIIVIDRNQRRVDLDNATVDPTDHHHASVGLEPNLPPGRYIVSFKTLGEADLDHDGGDFAFYVGMQPSGPDRAADATLAVTTITGDESLSGYRRGIVEGGLTVAIGAPAAFYYIQRRKRKERAADRSDGGLPPVAGPS